MPASTCFRVFRTGPASESGTLEDHPGNYFPKMSYPFLRFFSVLCHTFVMRRYIDVTYIKYIRYIDVTYLYRYVICM